MDAGKAIAMLSPLNPLWHTLQTHVTTPFPKPNPRTVRAGKKIHMIQWEWIKLLQDLAHSIPTGQWPQHISWHWHHQKVWFEYRQSYRLPPVACVALDATADRTQQIWHHLAQSNQKEARIVPIAAVGESPLFAKWYATQQLRTSRLISRQTHGVVWKERAIASIRRAAFTVAQTAQQAHLHAEHSIGILASKHVADLFRLACYQKAHPQFDPCDPCVLQMIHAIRSALDAWRLVIGHVGAHDIGSNLYCSVHLLAMLGSSKPDWGATCTDLEALGVATEDCHDLYTDIVAARDIQALARARHVRRKNVALLYIGDMSPPSGYELPDVQWTQIQAVHPQANQERLQLETKAEALLFKQGYVSVPQLQEEFGITRSISQNLCKKLQKTYDLYKWSIHNQRRGRPRVAWGFLAHAPHDPYQTQLALKSISTTCDRSEHDE